MKTYLTEVRRSDGKLYDGERVEALDWEHAQQIADARGNGEVVYGEHFLTIKFPEGMSEEEAQQRADAITQAFAENGTIPD